MKIVDDRSNEDIVNQWIDNKLDLFVRLRNTDGEICSQVLLDKFNMCRVGEKWLKSSNGFDMGQHLHSWGELDTLSMETEDGAVLCYEIVTGHDARNKKMQSVYVDRVEIIW